MNGFIFFKDRAPVRLAEWDIVTPFCEFTPDPDADRRVIKYFRTIDTLWAYVEYIHPLYKLDAAHHRHCLRVPNYTVYRYAPMSQSWVGVDYFDRIEIYDLKPCPFCGSDVTMVYSEQRGGRITHASDTRIMYGIKCNNGECVLGSPTKDFDHPHELVDAWNKRADTK